jgi:steroid delta-isomerase-like uncharacterized protein
MTERTGSSPRSLATEMFSLLSRHDLDGLSPHHHPDIVQEIIPIATFRGRESLRAFFSELYAAFPDFTIDLLDAMGEGDRVVAQWRVSGTFTGAPFLGIHATGKHVALQGCDVMRFEGGMLRENTVYYDGLAFARQVGLLPREGSAADKAMTAAFNASTEMRSRLHRRRSSEMAHAG